MNEDWSINMDRFEMKLPNDIIDMDLTVGKLKAVIRDLDHLKEFLEDKFENDAIEDIMDINNAEEILMNIKTGYKKAIKYNIKDHFEEVMRDDPEGELQ